MTSVRRIIPILLVAIFSFALIAPAVFAADAESNLPACCRRDGAHHCAMNASSAGTSLLTPRCPAFPASKNGPITQTVSAASVARVLHGGLVSHSTSRPQTDALLQISYNRAGQKRGPPTLL
jgi:hypothetical protein